MPCYDNNVVVYTTYPPGCASTSGGPFKLPLASDDVYYSGPDLPNSGIETTNILTEALQKLDYIYSVGTSGTSGTSSTSGTSGVNGTNGTDGTNGTSGIGSNGSSGTSGSGSNGTSGTDGTTGTSGTNGASGITGLTAGTVPKAASSTSLEDSLITETTGAVLMASTLEVSDGIRTSNTGPYLKFESIDIGDWDMVSNSGVTVSHGLGLDYTKIRTVEVLIRPDSDASFPDRILSILGNSSSTTMEGNWRIDGADIIISRVNAGWFDDVRYDATSYNRGWITISYIA